MEDTDPGNTHLQSKGEWIPQRDTQLTITIRTCECLQGIWNWETSHTENIFEQLKEI